MNYKWKPSAAAKAEFRATMAAAEEHQFININDAIRTGDELTFFSAPCAGLVSGFVVAHSYGAERGQHTFTIQDDAGDKHLVKGRNLYPRLTAFTKSIFMEVAK